MMVTPQPTLEELREQIARLEPIKRAQVLRFFPHLATPKNDHQKLDEIPDNNRKEE